MENEMKKYFKIIGEIQSIINKSETVDEATKACLKAMLESSHGSYAIVWYCDGDFVLHPYYWIGPKDFTNISYKKGEGKVGKVFETGEAIRILDFKNSPDESISKDFEGLPVSSVVFAPISDKDNTLGVVQFVKGEGAFTPDEADIIEMMTTLTSMVIKTSGKFTENYYKNKKVVISIKDVCKEFKNGEFITKVLKGVNLDIYEGEFLVLLGESGCGKSTLLNIISGLEELTTGNVYYKNTDISKSTKEELTEYRRNNIGFIFQSYNLMPNLTVKQNLDLIAELVESPLDSVETLKLVGLEEKVNNYPAQLSGGQQQRVSIARSLVKKPPLLMADEPTAALDYETSIEVLTALEKVKNEGTTLVMVTHNEEITKMADRVVRLRNGRVYEVTVNTNKLKAKELVW